MIKDRLPELRALQSDDEDGICIGVEERNRYMGDFFEEVELIRENIEKIEINLTNMKECHSAILSETQTDDSLTQQLQDLLAEIKCLANRVRGKLKAMELDIDLLAQNSWHIWQRRGWVSADFRIRQTQHSMLSQMFVEVMCDHNKTQSDYKERCEALNRRHLEIAGRLTPHEDILSEGQSVFTQDIVTDTQTTKLILADIDVRHEIITKLEERIQELHEMFIDLALMTECQGELIDRIEYHVKNSNDIIGTALWETLEANKAHKKKRRKKFIMVICLLVLVLVLILVVIGLFGF